MAQNQSLMILRNGLLQRWYHRRLTKAPSFWSCTRDSYLRRQTVLRLRIESKLGHLPLSRFSFFEHTAVLDSLAGSPGWRDAACVELRALCDEVPRTPPGPEGSTVPGSLRAPRNTRSPLICSVLGCSCRVMSPEGRFAGPRNFSSSAAQRDSSSPRKGGDSRNGTMCRFSWRE